MKTLLLFALTSISTNANAFQIVGDFPKIQFGNIFVSSLDVCVEGSYLKTIHAVPICHERARGEASVCVRQVKKHLWTPIKYSKNFPTEEGFYESISMTIPLNYKVAFGNMTESGIMPVYFQDFHIPACEAYKKATEE